MREAEHIMRSRYRVVSNSQNVRFNTDLDARRRIPSLFMGEGFGVGVTPYIIAMSSSR